MGVQYGYGKAVALDSLIAGYDTGDKANCLVEFPTQNLCGRFVADCSSTSSDTGSGYWNGFSHHSSYGISIMTDSKDGRENTIRATYPSDQTQSGDVYPTFKLVDESGNPIRTNGGEVFYFSFEWKSEGAEHLVAGNDNWDTSTFYGNGWKNGSHLARETVLFNQPIGNGWYRTIYKYTAAAVADQEPLMRMSAGYKTASGGDYNIWLDNLIMQRDYPTAWIPGQTSIGSNESMKDMIGGSFLNLDTTFINQAGKLSFDGVDDRISFGDIGYPSQSTHPFSLEVIMKVDDGDNWYNQGSGTAIVARGSYSGSHGLFRTSTNNQLMMWMRPISGGSRSVTGSIARNKYNHIVGTWDGVNVDLYINGVHQGTSGGALQGIDGGSWLVGGNVAAGGNNGLYGAGEYPVVKIYKKALTAGEVQQSFGNYKSRFNI